MSNGLPDPDSILTPGETPIDAVNGVLNGLNPTAKGLNNGANGLNGTPTRKDSGEEGGPGGGQQADGGVAKVNKGMILGKSVEYIRWVCFLLFYLAEGEGDGSWSSFYQQRLPHPFFRNQPMLTPSLYHLDTYNNS